MIRLLRLLKLVRLVKQSKQLKVLGDALSMSNGMKQLVGIFMALLFSTHIVGCLWYMIAMSSGFPPLSWVVRQGIIDSDINMKYLQSIYWAF